MGVLSAVKFLVAFTRACESNAQSLQHQQLQRPQEDVHTLYSSRLRYLHSVLSCMRREGAVAILSTIIQPAVSFLYSMCTLLMLLLVLFIKLNFLLYALHILVSISSIWSRAICLCSLTYSAPPLRWQ